MAAEEAELSPKAKDMIAEYEGEVDKELAKTTKAVLELRNDLIEDLEKEVKSQTRRGNLEVAMALQSKVDQLKSHNPVTDVFGARATEAKNKFAIVGSWLCENDGMYELRVFGKDGRFEYYQSDAKANKGKLNWKGNYYVGESGLAEARHPKKKNKVFLHTVNSDGTLIVKMGSKQFKGKRLKKSVKR